MRFTVKNREIYPSNGTPVLVIGDNADYKAQFDFDSEWNGVVKTARFVRGKKFQEMVLVNDECEIPIEVLKQGFLEIGVFSAEMTTTPCRILVKGSIKELGGATAEPTPDVYRQIIKMIEDLEVVGVTDAQIEKAVRDYLEENPITGVDESEVQRIVAEYINLHKNELKGEKGDKGDKGDKGEKGEKGDKGDTGANGKDGVDGLDGSNGADGKSAYDIARDNGFEGTEAEWLESLKGKDGEGSDGIAWSEESVLLLKDILYSCVDSTEKAKVDLLIGELLPNYEPDEPVIPDEPIEPTPEVPQSGTWQLKTTTPKKYVIVATDDDNQGNAKFFRMLRTYGFPYTMNTEAEKINADLGSDVDTTIFTDVDAPSIFSDGVTVADLGKYIHDNNLGEVAQHGSSANTLWDSENLTGSKWTELYDSYTSQGGTKSEDELKTAITEAMASTDGSQDASYVAESRTILEEALGFPILTVGAWGGSPQCTIDGIELDLNSFKGTSNYDWRGHNYFGVSSYVADFHVNTNPYNISRMNDGPSEILKYVDMLPYGKVVEFFWHMPFHDNPVADYRTLFDTMKQMQSEGKIDVVTRYQYSQLGEYVDNPITSIKVTRSGSINVGETDSDSAYTVSVTYADGTTGSPASDMILDTSKVSTEESGSYEVYAYYRGFVGTCNVVVMGASYTVPSTLKDTDYWFVYKNETNGNMYCGNYSKEIIEAVKTGSMLLQFNASESGGKINGWKSTDNGVTWTQVTTDRTMWNTTITTNKKSDVDGGYMFDNTYNEKITWIETSGNFALNY